MPYTLKPCRCRHRDESRRLILEAARAVSAGRAAILGAGACDEIPLSELAARFAGVTLNDIDERLLQRGIDEARLDSAARQRITIAPGDLSGVTAVLLGQIQIALADAAEPAAAVEAMAAVLDSRPQGACPIEGQFDLVVASCVLSQLHFALVHESAAAFEKRFAGSAEQLQASPRWSGAVYELARSMEAQFISDLARLVTREGRIYLSESAQMCYIELTTGGQWQSEGTYRMLRSKSLEDYLDERFTILDRARWEWVVMPPEKPGDKGRLYDVQAVILQPSPLAGESGSRQRAG